MKGITTTAAAMLLASTLSPAWGTDGCFDRNREGILTGGSAVCAHEFGLANHDLLRGIHDEQHIFEVRRLREGAIAEAMAGLPQHNAYGLVFGAGVGENRGRAAVAVGGTYGMDEFSLSFGAGAAGGNTTRGRISIQWRP